MPVSVTRRTVLQKVRGCTHKVLPQLVDTGFQVLFHSPPGVLFTFPSQYYALSVTKEYLALGGGPPNSHKVSRVSWYFGSCSLDIIFTYGAFTLCGRSFQDRSVNESPRFMQSITAACTHAGLGSFHFARRYFGNRVFFLFLRLLRCFSSAGSQRMAMDSPYAD